MIRNPRTRAAARSGLTLLEVLLSIAILGGALATIGELIRVGSRSAARARDMTRAQMMAESKMAEITTGALPLTPVMQSAMETDPDWLYSIDVQPVDNEGMQAVTLLIEQNIAQDARGTSYQLTRWVRDEDLDFTEELEETEGSTNSASTSSGASSGTDGGGQP